MITCQQLVEFLDDYLAGDLSPPALARFDEHLAVCPDCVHFVDSYRQTRELARAALRGDDSVTPIPEGVIRAVLAARSAAP